MQSDQEMRCEGEGEAESKGEYVLLFPKKTKKNQKKGKNEQKFENPKLREERERVNEKEEKSEGEKKTQRNNRELKMLRLKHDTTTTESETLPFHPLQYLKISTIDDQKHQTESAAARKTRVFFVFASNLSL